MKLDEPIHRRVEHERSYEFHPSAYIITTDGTEDIDDKIKDVYQKRTTPFDYVIVTEPSGRQETRILNPNGEINTSPEYRWFPYAKVVVDSENEIIDVLKFDLTHGFSPKTLTSGANASKYGPHKEGDKTVGTLWLAPQGFPNKESAKWWMTSAEYMELVDSILREVKKEEVDEI